jgi:hypothetical protein
MSARKLSGSSGFEQQGVTVEARQTRLSLSPESVLIRKNGIEFRSPSSFSPWTEMTVSLQSPADNGRVNCTGVVVACTGNRHTGYHVSMLFTGLSKQSQARLSTMAGTPLD